MDIIDLSLSDVIFSSTTESLLATSQYAKVVFHNVSERFNSDEDLTCHYSMQNIPQRGDRILLLQLGWESIMDYILTEPAPVESLESYTVTFSKRNLPRNCVEFYQFCYVTVDDMICGASIPFQFTELTCGSCEVSNERLEAYRKDVQILEKKVEELSKSLTESEKSTAKYKLRLQMAEEAYKKLYMEKVRAERKYEKLAKKCQAKKSLGEVDVLGELEPLPPMPILPKTSQDFS